MNCPACYRLVHTDELKRLGQEAGETTRAGDLRGARDAWRRALELLPHGSSQFEAVSVRIADLNREIGAAPEAGQPGAGRILGWLKRAGPLGAIVLILWKFKLVLGFVASKGKLLLLGLTKGTTLFSMLLSLGVYWAVWGWKFALGLVASIYVHEMGHVACLRHFGIPATAPMFIPGLGAIVRLKQHPATAGEDSRTGLAGPIWGLGAALAAYGLFLATSAPILAAVARVGAWINLFNLIPVWQLDGGRGIRALSRKERWLLAALVGLMWILTREGMLVLLLLAMIYQAAAGRSAPKPDGGVLVQYALLVVALSLLCLISVPGVQTRG